MPIWLGAPQLAPDCPSAGNAMAHVPRGCLGTKCEMHKVMTMMQHACHKCLMSSYVWACGVVMLIVDTAIQHATAAAAVTTTYLACKVSTDVRVWTRICGKCT